MQSLSCFGRVVGEIRTDTSGPSMVCQKELGLDLVLSST